jgi:hypothetical protein
VETGTAWRAPTRRGACYFILPAISRVILLVFLLVSAAIDEENYFTFRWLWQWSSIGQGHQDPLPLFPLVAHGYRRTYEAVLTRGASVEAIYDPLDLVAANARCCFSLRETGVH